MLGKIVAGLSGAGGAAAIPAAASGPPGWVVLIALGVITVGGTYVATYYGTKKGTEAAKKKRTQAAKR